MLVGKAMTRTYKFIDDCRDEQRKRIQRAVAAHVDDGRGVRLPVLDAGPEVRHLELLVLRARLLVRRQTPQDALLVGLGEELGIVGEVMDHPEGRDTDEDGAQTLQDEDPRPAVLPADSIHLRDCGREETAEGTGQRRCGEEDGHADAELAAPVPARQVVSHAGEEAGFAQAQEPSCRQQPGVVVDEAHKGHAEALDAVRSGVYR